eukprot:gene9152-9320_t
MLLHDQYSSDYSDEDSINEEEKAELEELKAVLGERYVMGDDLPGALDDDLAVVSDDDLAVVSDDDLAGAELDVGSTFLQGVIFGSSAAGAASVAASSGARGRRLQQLGAGCDLGSSQRHAKATSLADADIADADRLLGLDGSTANVLKLMRTSWGLHFTVMILKLTRICLGANSTVKIPMMMMQHWEMP